MGYYTYHTLEVEGGEAIQRCPTCGHVGTWDWEDLISKFVGSKYECGEYYPFQASCKWYEYEEHMLEFSQLYPTYLFIIEGDGEETDDRWRHYFKNGKHHRDGMVMEFPDFNPETLE